MFCFISLRIKQHSLATNLPNPAQVTEIEYIMKLGWGWKHLYFSSLPNFSRQGNELNEQIKNFFLKTETYFLNHIQNHQAKTQKIFELMTTNERVLITLNPRSAQKCPHPITPNTLSIEELDGRVQLKMANCRFRRWGMSFLPPPG